MRRRARDECGVVSAAAKPISRILSAVASALAGLGSGGTTIPLALPSLAGSSDLPGGFGRAVLERLPIWSCSVRGFACHRPYGRRGALLPHLFTLTRLRPRPIGLGFGPRQALRHVTEASPQLEARSAESEGGRYIFCATGPSGYPARALPGALPMWSSDFPLLPALRGRRLRAVPRLPPAAVVWPGCGIHSPADCAMRALERHPRSSFDSLPYPSVSCEIRYCSSFL